MNEDIKSLSMPDWFTNPLPHGLDSCSRNADFWPTPAGAITSLLDSDPPPRGHTILEPCAGNGAIVRMLQDRGYNVVAIEIRRDAVQALLQICPVLCYDFLELSTLPLDLTEPPSLKATMIHDAQSIVTNPPFSLARRFATQCIQIADYVALLLRMNTLGSNTWADFWLAHPPSAIRPLRKRPSFSGDGKTDACEYGWFIWDERPAMDIKPI